MHNPFLYPCSIEYIEVQTYGFVDWYFVIKQMTTIFIITCIFKWLKHVCEKHIAGRSCLQRFTSAGMKILAFSVDFSPGFQCMFFFFFFFFHFQASFTYFTSIFTLIISLFWNSFSGVFFFLKMGFQNSKKAAIFHDFRTNIRIHFHVFGSHFALTHAIWLSWFCCQNVPFSDLPPTSKGTSATYNE